MKVILSRKGFDSANGGIVSPILEDGTMISFPIPSDDRNTYNQLHYKNVLYSKMLSDLKYKGGQFCHVDPDLDQGRRVCRIEGWEPAFGQIDSSSTYLKNIKIEEGDLFLFFGNFHHVICRNDTYRYIKKSGDFYKDNDLQVIWGYLQVGRIIDSPDEQKKFWWHPHSADNRTNNKTNIIITSTSNLSFAPEKKGAGLLAYDQKRVLTAEGCNKATWIKRSIYDVNNILANRKNSSRDPEKGIYYAGIWQELGLVQSDECTEWAQHMVM